MKKLLNFSVCFLSFFTLAMAQEKQNKPKPDIENEKYGPHERNVFDLWKAKSDSPTPMLIYFHSGGFSMGSKDWLPADVLQMCLESGISVASSNYRLTDSAPYPAPMQDAARAVQYIRFKAKEFNLDPTRFAAMGGSAGGGISLWLAFHDDLADAKAEDEVLQQSTRLSCVIGGQAQCSYDPRWIKKNIGGRTHEEKNLKTLFGVTAKELLTDKAAKLYEDASAINHLTKDDPPVMVIYSGGDEPSNQSGAGIHSKKFGEALKAAMDKLGLSCDNFLTKSGGRDVQKRFLIKHLKPKE